MTLLNRLLCGMVFFSMMTIECMIGIRHKLKEKEKRLSLAEIKDLYEKYDNYKVKVVLSDKAIKLFEQVKT